MGNKSPQKLRLLFVCYGNMCRSPMAAGLASRLLPPGMYVESAGLNPSRHCAAPEAVAVMRTECDIDISGHRPQAVAALNLDEFHYIIALDAYVYDYLKHNHRLTEDQLIRWDIADPYMGGIAAYVTCLTGIKLKLAELSRLCSVLRPPDPAPD